MNEEMIYDIVVRNISEALLVPREKINLSARLLSDLNAESIDIADVRFRLEHDFNLRIEHKQMINSVGTNLSANEFDNRFTVQFILDHVKRLLKAAGVAE